MTKLQKIIKYAAIVLAIFLCVCIIGGICSALLSASYFFGKAPAAEVWKKISYASLFPNGFCERI